MWFHAEGGQMPLLQKATTRNDDESALLLKLDMLWFLSSIAVWIAIY
jgi:MFS family permease